MMKLLYLPFLLFLFTIGLQGQTNVNGPIQEDTTWDLDGSPYILNGEVQVETDVTLTIEPGVTVIFPDEDADLYIDGALSAVGTPGAIINFVGDLENDIHGGTLILGLNSTSAVINYANFEKLGNTEGDYGIVLYLIGFFNNLNATISNTEFHDVEGYCAFTYYFESATFNNCCFYNIEDFGLGGGVAIYNLGTNTVEAQSCYWGSALGPNETGSVLTLGAVNVDNFLTQCTFSSTADVAALDLVSPTSGCDLTTSETVSIEIINNGTTTESNFPVGYSLNGSDYTENFNQTIAPGEIKTHTFSSSLNLSGIDVYEIEIFTDLSSDEVQTNDRKTVTVEHFQPFDFEIIGPEAVCQNEGYYLYVDLYFNYQYEWSNGSTDYVIYDEGDITTTYSVTVTDNFGCVSIAEKTVVVNPVPAQPTIVASSTELCPGSSITLSTTPGNIQWSTGETTPTITVTTEGYYGVTAISDEGCTTTSQYMYINEVSAPYINPSGNGVICEGEDISLFVSNANFNSTYLWSTGATTQSITDMPLTDHTYLVTVTKGNCTFVDEFTVIVEPDLPPGAVSNLLPPNGALGVALPVNFSWAPAENAASYDLYVGLEGTTPLYYGNTTQINYITYGLNYGNTYCWQVIPRSCSGMEGPPSPIQCFTLEYLPDLIVPEISTPTTTAFAGAEIEIEWVVRNIGLEETSNNGRTDAVYLSLDTQYDFGDRWLGNVYAQDYLAPNQSVQKSLLTTLPECETGDYYLIVVADRYGGIQEEVEDNNTGVSSEPINIQSSPTPDLRPLGTTTIDVAGFAQAGESYNVNFQVINDGDLATENPFLIRLYIDTLNHYNPPTADWLKNYSFAEILEAGESSGPLQVEITIPENLDSDEYFIHVVLDYNDAVEECIFEANNIGSTAEFSVLEIPKPDFELTEVAVVQDTVGNYQTVTVSYEITNTENDFEGNLSDRVYICPSPNLNIPVTSVLNSGPVTIGNNETIQREASFSIPGYITGKFYFLVYTNVGNYQEETNYDNNVGPYDSVIVASPNLIPVNLEVPGSTQTGQQMLVEWEVSNIGVGGVFNTNLIDRIYLSEDEELDLANDAFLGFQSGQITLFPSDFIARSKSVAIPNDTAPGMYYIIVHTNAASTVYENADYDDNIIVSSNQINIAEGQYPDLVAEEITPDETVVTAGEAIVLSFEISNQGDATAIGSWQDAIYRCTCSTWNPNQASFVASIPHTQALSVGSEYSKTYTDQLPFSLNGGTYYYYIQTDRSNQLYEEDESSSSNVRRSLNAVEVTAYDFGNVNLALQDVDPPCDVLPGQSATVSYVSRNVGTSSTVAGNWFDGIVLSTDNIWNPSEDTLVVAQWPHANNLTPGQSYAGLQTFTLPANLSGTYYVLLVTDLFNANNETGINLNNNAVLLPQISCEGGGGSDPIIYPPKPDLIVEITNAPSTAIAGQPIMIQYRVTNDSEVEAIGNWSERAFLATDMNIFTGANLGSSNAQIGSLEPGAFYDGEMEVTIPIAAEGNYFLLLKTDAGGGIFEEDENNNVADRYIFVVQAPPSDLVVKNINAPLVDTTATQMTVNWVVENTGFNPAEGILYQGVYLSEDETWDAADLLLGTEEYFVALNAFQTTSFSLSGRIEGTKRQDYYVIVRTDLQNNIAEVNDTNNTAVSLLPSFIEVPEIIVDAPAISADAPLALPIYYRIEIPENQAGETVRITLESEDFTAFNELYIAYQDIPSRTTYDFGFEEPFSRDQQIIIPEVEAGTYYVMVYPVEGMAMQEVELRARIVPFEIIAVEANEGGNTGLVTVKLTGGKLVEDMEIWLDNGVDPSIYAQEIFLVNSTKAYVTFDLQGASIGMYDVHGERMNPITQNTVLQNGFEVTPGTISNQFDPLIATCSMDFGGGTFIVLDVADNLSPLVFGKFHQEEIRPGQVAKVKIAYRNPGNVDVPIPQRLFTSNGFPLSLTNNDFSQGLQELNLAFPFDTGSQNLGVVPPGETVVRTFYVKAEGSTDNEIKIYISD